MTRVAIIGAGPAGLEAALALADRGGDVIVFERGRIGGSLRDWGDAVLITSLEQTFSPLVHRALGLKDGPGAPQTGPELVDQVLLPLSKGPLLAGRIQERCSVLAVGRKAGGFLLLVRSGRIDQLHEVDAVIDASGTQLPRSIGPAGVPVPGELVQQSRFIRTLAGLERGLPEVANRRVLLIGDGLSAARSALMLSELIAEHRKTEVVWLLSKAPKPAEGDAFPARRALFSRAQALAQDPPAGMRLLYGGAVERLEAAIDGVEVWTGGASESSVFQMIVAFTGRRPDLTPLTELPVALSPKTDGLLGVAARMEAAPAGQPPEIRPGDEDSGVPGFYLLGRRAFGRTDNFQLASAWPLTEQVVRAILS